MADFGFAKIADEGSDATHISTQVKGTAGYLDPEYLRTYQLTDKSDVYSFGVILVEIVSGRRPIELKRGARDRLTVKWVGDVASLPLMESPCTPQSTTHFSAGDTAVSGGERGDGDGPAAASEPGVRYGCGADSGLSGAVPGSFEEVTAIHEALQRGTLGNPQEVLGHGDRRFVRRSLVYGPLNLLIQREVH